MKCRAGVLPSFWFHEDVHELGVHATFENCLDQAHRAGFSSIEWGRLFPEESVCLRKSLEKRSLTLAAGLLELEIVKNGASEERGKLVRRGTFLKKAGADTIILFEGTGQIFRRPEVAIVGPSRPSLPRDAWKKMAAGLDELACVARDMGLRAVYYPRMGTLVQSEADIDQLMRDTNNIELLLDTGQSVMAEADPVGIMERWGNRVGHVYLKSFRSPIGRAALKEALGYADAVRRGICGGPTGSAQGVKGVAQALRRMDYAGWVMAGAEQDPCEHPPLENAQRARAYIKKTFGV